MIGFFFKKKDIQDWFKQLLLGPVRRTQGFQRRKDNLGAHKHTLFRAGLSQAQCFTFLCRIFSWLCVVPSQPWRAPPSLSVQKESGGCSRYYWRNGYIVRKLGTPLAQVIYSFPSLSLLVKNYRTSQVA